MRLEGYVRVSRVGGREGEGYISPDVQREAIRAYASELGGEIVSWAVDEDYSGGNADRPAFQAALERLQADETDGLVVMRVDRFARSVADGARIVREILDRDQIFASCHERIDPRTPEGRYMLTSFLANAELFLDQAKAGWWMAKSRAVARGAHIGPTPIGYRRCENGVLEPDPVVGPVITELFRLAAGRTMGDTDLARWFTERVPRESRAYQPSEIRRWLRTRVYLGEVRYGELVNNSAHQALVDEDIWQRAQRAPGIQRRPTERFLLSGLLRCANCRYSMGGFSRGGAKHQTRVYRCGSRCGHGPVITAALIEQHLIDQVREHFTGVAVGGVTSREVGELQRELAAAEEEVRLFAADTTARRLLGEAEWQAALRVRVEARDTLRDRHDAVFAEHQVAAAVRDLDSLDRHGLADLLEGAIRHVFIRRGRGVPVCERALIIWSDDTREIEVAGPHRSGVFEPIRW